MGGDVGAGEGYSVGGPGVGLPKHGANGSDASHGGVGGVGDGDGAGDRCGVGAKV